MDHTAGNRHRIVEDGAANGHRPCAVGNIANRDAGEAIEEATQFDVVQVECAATATQTNAGLRCAWLDE